MIERQHMIIRANELARATGGRISAHDLAAKLAAEFRHASDDVLHEWFLRLVSSKVIEPDLGEEDSGDQLALPMPLTGFLRVRTDDGDLEFVAADIALGQEALAAMTAKEERHRTQARRAGRKRQQIRGVMAWPGYTETLPYNTNCAEYRKALESGQ